MTKKKKAGPNKESVCKKEIEKAIKYVDKLKRPKDFFTVAHYDLPKSTTILMKHQTNGITQMLKHNKMCRNIIERNEGLVRKELGDADLATFNSFAKALSCSIKVISNLKKHGCGICTKVTMTVGTLEEVNTDGKSDIYGLPMNVCTRISEYAEVDAILIEDENMKFLNHLLEGSKEVKIGRPFSRTLKNFGKLKLRLIHVL